MKITKRITLSLKPRGSGVLWYHLNEEGCRAIQVWRLILEIEGREPAPRGRTGSQKWWRE